jgi:hypothetical protein
MIIALEGFGSIWSVRRGQCPERTAFYNTTGILSGERLRHSSRIFGQLRFNAIGGFHPRHVERNIGRVFESPGIPDPSGCLLLHHFLDGVRVPDYYLFTVTADRAGELRIDQAGWKSDGVVLVAMSEFREQQESMLLMPPHAWIRSGLGRFVVQPIAARPWRAVLELTE